MEDCAVLAHILWELTFYGYTAQAVKAEKVSLEETLDRIEKGEEKLIPWDEII